MKTIFLNACLLVFLAVCQDSHQQDKVRVPNKGAGVSDEVLRAYDAREFDGMPYRLLLPAEFNRATKYPLVLSLHGGAGVGNDNRSSLRNWNARFVDENWRAKYPCIVVVPQSPGSWSVTGELLPRLTEERKQSFSQDWQSWVESRNYPPGSIRNGSLSRVFALIDDLAEQYPVDTNRIYVLGHSMGGLGTWNAVWAAPERFAAAIPSAGGLLPWKDPAGFRQVPIWAFHGEHDTRVPTGFTREIFARMQEVGGNMKYTELQDVGHGAAQYTFAWNGSRPEKNDVTRCSSRTCDTTEDIWDWLFAQRLDQRENQIGSQQH